MKNKIAVIIPTVKPYNVSCKLAVDSIISSINRNPIADFDIFISGPQDPNDDRVKFIKEEKQEGENVTNNYLVAQVVDKYDYIFLSSDDFIVESSCNLLDAIEFLESESFSNRKMKICSISTSTDSPCVTGPFLSFPEGSSYGKDYRPNNAFIIPAFTICRFPFVKTSTVKKYLNNRFYPNSIYSGYGDICLSYFLYANKEPCLEFAGVKLSFMNHIHSIDRVARRNKEWIQNRSVSCINAYSFISGYSEGKIYE